MRLLDWVVLVTAVVGIVVYGVWKGRGSKDLQGYLLSNRNMKWHTIALSIMATQASAITFLATPGQAYVDGMRFVQFYFGLPIAAVILSVTAIPIYHKLKVYTAYEYLENRFDAKTRSLTAFLFLIQRSLAAGFTIFAPALVLSVILGWDLTLTNLVVGVLVITYTASGGTRAVSWTQFYQMVLIMSGMVIAFLIIIYRLPEEVTFLDATHLAGAMGRLNAVDLSFDPTFENRFNIWSGIIAGCFLQLSYFGTDQSQVQRYLTGRSITQSRMGLLTNGLLKVPMQFFILFVGAMVFAFYQFTQPPIFFNPVEVESVRETADAGRFAELEGAYAAAFEVKRERALELIAARRGGDASTLDAASGRLAAADAEMSKVRDAAVEILEEHNPRMAADTNYVFLTFVVDYLPVGVVGLLIAAILFASMSSTSSELNALASTTVVDLYRRWLKRDGSETHYLKASKLATVIWGLVAIGFAQSFRGYETLVVAVNWVGSIFYGTILGVFLAAFYVKRLGGTAVFLAAVGAQTMVIVLNATIDIAFLWYNVIGCVLVIAGAALIQPFLRRATR